MDSSFLARNAVWVTVAIAGIVCLTDLFWLGCFIFAFATVGIPVLYKIIDELFGTQLLCHISYHAPGDNLIDYDKGRLTSECKRCGKKIHKTNSGDWS